MSTIQSSIGPHARPGGAAQTALSSQAHRRYLVGPITDFLCLGGASLIVLPLVVWLVPPESKAGLAIVTMLLASVINHPHFAYSYQMFYRSFRHKIAGADLAASLRLRYFVAGIVVPVALFVFFAVVIAREDTHALGLAYNLMGLLVGWHYAKQGYGMAILDSALKRQFYPATGKRVLLLNAHACWVVTWLAANRVVNEADYLGLKTFTFAIPDGLFVAAAAVAIATSVMVVLVLADRWRTERTLPWNGIVGYFAAIYPWLVFVKASPLLLYVVPAFHSIQYLVVVWRFESNRTAAQPGAQSACSLPLLRFVLRSQGAVRGFAFVLSGLVLGFLGFWALPAILDQSLVYDPAVFGTTLFLFVFWIFINVHHYFLDNVMWRRDNPEMQRHLFGA